MIVSGRGLGLIKRYEQLRLKAYMPTPNDVWTIGYGHTDGVGPTLTCTEQQADVWLFEDSLEAMAAVDEVRAPLTQNQYDACVSLAFNIGAGAFRASTLKRLLDAKEYGLAALQFARWNKQSGKVLNGLTKRRAEEAALFNSPE